MIKLIKMSMADSDSASEGVRRLGPLRGAQRAQQARQLARHTPAATAALTQIASAAGAADRRLRDLMKEIQ